MQCNGNIMFIFIWEKEERHKTPNQTFCLLVCETESTISRFRAGGQDPGMMLFAQQKEL